MLKDWTIREIIAEAGRNSRQKGWHDLSIPTSLAEQTALLHTEVAEVTEEYRHNHEPTETYFVEDANGFPKPCGIPTELADVIIKTCEIADRYGVDLVPAIGGKLAYNALRPRRHGGKRI
jgi:hypothetical protein